MRSRALGAQVSGPVPDRLAEWFGGRDIDPLEPGIVVRWQSKSRGRVLRNDHRADLADDGRLWVRWHPEGAPPDAAFAGRYTGEPTTQLDPADLHDLLELLAAEDFTDQDPYQGTDDEGGDAVALRARLDGVEHEVIYVSVSSPFLARFRAIVSSTRVQ